MIYRSTPSKEEVEQIFQDVRSQFEVKDMGEPSGFLGSGIQRNYQNRTVTISQQAYTEEILRLAEIQNCKATPIPLSSSWVWDDDNKDPETLLYGKDQTKYRALVGRLNWLAVETRPDIKLADMKLQHRGASPTESETYST